MSWRHEGPLVGLDSKGNITDDPTCVTGYAYREPPRHGGANITWVPSVIIPDGAGRIYQFIPGHASGWDLASKALSRAAMKVAWEAAGAANEHQRRKAKKRKGAGR